MKYIRYTDKEKPVKTITLLDTNWYLKRLDPVDRLDISRLDEILKDGSDRRDKLMRLDRFPAQVYEILAAYGIIENPNIRGDSTKCRWVSESDWIYFNDFGFAPTGRKTYFDFQGLDTYADIYLNGELLASHDDVYLPRRTDVSGKLQNNNRLVIHFHSPRKKFNEVILPDHVRDAAGKIKPGARTRMFGSTMHDYLGPRPDLFRAGIYDEVRIAGVDRREIVEMRTPYDLSKDYGGAVLYIDLELNPGNDRENISAVMRLLDPEGRELGSETIPADEKKAEIHGMFRIQNPMLWWPRSHGPSHLYTISVDLLVDGDVVDTKTRKTGFRNIERIGDFDFTVNSLPLKIWGSNIAPADTLTNVYNGERMNRLLDLAELANHNCLRVWGEDERLRDEFYEECDRRGILIWQDFFTAYSMYDTDLHTLDLLRQEAEYQVRRLRDHPCILLWCGGNESLMCAEFEFPGEEMLGIEIFDEVFPSVCGRLDPKRYYHRSSPDGGAYANDPLEGDTHGYTHVWFVPGNHYPLFLSENNRVSAPAKRTMKRMMKDEDLWPIGYDGLQHKNSEFPWPEQWNKYNSSQGHLKLGDIGAYYDAADLDAMLYRLGWAHGDYLRRSVERCRRGIPEGRHGRRVTKGHLLWKLNNSCNHIFFGVIDYFLEPYIAYYAIKRAYEPVLLSFDVGNFINLWMVNDTTKNLSGKVTVRLFNPQKNCVTDSFTVPFEIASDESRLVANLDRFGQFRSSHILHAYAVTHDGRRVTESVDYADIERHIRFPTDGKISAEWDNGDLILRSSRYERSVEILGMDDGDEFGWLFDDNYFDLMPGQNKRVKVFAGKHRKGTITVMGYYSGSAAAIAYNG